MFVPADLKSEDLTAPMLFGAVMVVMRVQLGMRGDWSRAVEVFLELQMAGLEPNRQICEALLKVLEHAKRAKQVRIQTEFVRMPPARYLPPYFSLMVACLCSSISPVRIGRVLKLLTRVVRAITVRTTGEVPDERPLDCLTRRSGHQAIGELQLEIGSSSASLAEMSSSAACLVVFHTLFVLPPHGPAVVLTRCHGSCIKPCRRHGSFWSP